MLKVTFSTARLGLVEVEISGLWDLGCFSLGIAAARDKALIAARQYRI